MTECSRWTTASASSRASTIAWCEPARGASSGEFLEGDDRRTRGLTRGDGEVMLDAFHCGGVGCRDGGRFRWDDG